MSQLEISVLGPARFRRDGSYLSLSSAKAVSLLGYLSVEGRAQRRDHLMAVFWPDSLPQAARKNLRNTLWGVRKSLGDETIIPDADSVALGPTVWVDVQIIQDPSLLAPPPDLTDIEAASSLFRGPLLEGLVLTDAPDFELWLAAERERLRQQYLRLLELLIAGNRSRANWPGVIDFAQKALSWDSLQEPMHRALMEAFGRLGDRSRALRQYESLTTLLGRELGVEPLAETKALRERVMSGSLQPAPTHPPPSKVRRSPSPRRQQSTRSPFVGRVAELEQLNQAWHQAGRGESRTVLLTGELGIGKSRLWEEWRSNLPANLIVLETYCLDTKQAHPFGPVIRLLRNDPCAAKLLGASSPLAPIWLAELSRLLPEIRDSNSELPVPVVLRPAEERIRLLEALNQLIRQFSEKPFILFIDDLHWADLPTLDWLVYLVDSLRTAPFLLILAYRPDELPSQATRIIAGWHRQKIVRRVMLPHLTLSETAKLLIKLGNDEKVAPALQKRSAGNPYFLVELSRTGPDTLPPSLTDLIHARLQALPEKVGSWLKAASVLKGDFELDLLKRTAGRDEAQTLDILDLLLESGLFVEHGSEYSFTHPLVASLIYDELTVARRRYFHSRAAAAIEATHSGQLARVAAGLAEHYAGSGEPAKAAFYADMAATRALEMSALEDAVALCRQAYLWDPTLQRMTYLGQALAAAGDIPAAQKVYRQALAEYDKDGDRTEIAQAQLALAGSYMFSGEREQVVLWANRAMTKSVGTLEPEMEAQAHLMMAMGGAADVSGLSEAEGHLMRAGTIAEANGLVQLALQSQFERANFLAQRGELEEAVVLFALTAKQAKENAEPVQEMLAFNNLAYHLHLLGDSSAKEQIEKALALAEEYSLTPYYQFLFNTRGEIALAGDAFDESERWFERALAAAVVANNVAHQANVRANLGMLAQARGDMDTALLLLQEARTDIPTESESFLKIKIDLWTAELHLARGERAAAREVMERVWPILAQGEYEGFKRRAGALEFLLKDSRR